MTHFLSGEGAGLYLYLYLLVLNIFVLGLVFWISRSVYIPLLLLIQLDSSVVVSCSSLFCESGQQPVAKGLTESCTVILTIMLFFFLASKYQSQNPCCPQ